MTEICIIDIDNWFFFFFLKDNRRVWIPHVATETEQKVEKEVKRVLIV